MLYGKNPWQGCANIGELREKIKKEVVFPGRPWVGKEVKELIRQMVRVEERDRVDWNTLFVRYLEGKGQGEGMEGESVTQEVVEYFGRSAFLEGEGQL